MKVLALDPGYDRLGVAVMEKRGGDETLLYSGCITSDKNQPFSLRLSEIGDAVRSLIKEHAPGVVALETLFFNKNVKTALMVSEVRGVVVFLAVEAGCELREFGPQEIKVAVTGYGKSDKAAVIDMVKRLLKKVPEKAHDDEYDAIAVGITALAHYRA